MAPSTNNALESTNRVGDTLKKRLVLSRFTVLLFSIVNKWSKQRNPTDINSKKIRTSTITVWFDAYSWVQLNKDVISICNDDTTMYYLFADEKKRITDKAINRCGNCRLSSFDT